MSKRFVKVATTDEVASGAIKSVEVDGERVALCNVDGEYYAVHDECTHEQFPLSAGDLDDRRLTCSLHGACFDVRSGEVLALPATDAVKTYEVKVEDGDVLVAVE